MTDEIRNEENRIEIHNQSDEILDADTGTEPESICEVEDVEEEEDHDFVRVLGIGALIGAAALYAGSKVVKKIKEKKRKTKIAGFMDRFKKQKDKEDVENVEEDDYTEVVEVVVTPLKDEDVEEEQPEKEEKQEN